MLYQLYARQELPVTLEKAWDFLSDPRNLETITPKMGFRILSGADKAMFRGQIIQYIVSPFPGVKTRWVTEITHVENEKYFVDEQRFGPYAFWHHKHFLRETENGTIMEDIIDYKLPLGFLGRLMHALIVKKKLTGIFKYRAEKLIALYGKINDSDTKLSVRKIH